LLEGSRARLEILKAYVSAGHPDVAKACGYDHKPIDVSDWVQRANAAAKLGDDVQASVNLRVAAEIVAAQGVGIPGYANLTACVPPSQVYSTVGQFLALSVIEEKRSRLVSDNLRIDAANALRLLETDPTANKKTIDSLVASGLVSKVKAHPTSKPQS
jgi:hypothetical protein